MWFIENYSCFCHQTRNGWRNVPPIQTPNPIFKCLFEWQISFSVVKTNSMNQKIGKLQIAMAGCIPPDRQVLQQPLNSVLSSSQRMSWLLFLNLQGRLLCYSATKNSTGRVTEFRQVKGLRHCLTFLFGQYRHCGLGKWKDLFKCIQVSMVKWTRLTTRPVL